MRHGVLGILKRAKKHENAQKKEKLTEGRVCGKKNAYAQKHSKKLNKNV